MTDDAQSLAAELERSMSGETWFGPSLSALLEGVDAVAASRRLDGAPHSILQIVSHLAVWARYAAYRFEGGVPRDLDEENWSPASAVDDAAWSSTREALYTAYDRAADALGALPAGVLDAVDDTTPVDGDGEPVTLRRVAAGVAQHAAYHAGQIAVVKRLIAGGDAPT